MFERRVDFLGKVEIFGLVSKFWFDVIVLLESGIGFIFVCCFVGKIC